MAGARKRARGAALEAIVTTEAFVPGRIGVNDIFVREGAFAPAGRHTRSFCTSLPLAFSPPSPGV